MNKAPARTYQLVFISLLALLSSISLCAGTPDASKTNTTKTAAARKPAPKKKHYYERFYTSSFDDTNTAADNPAGEDPALRAAAIEALGRYNGTVVVTDPDSGRILAMVNQKLALSEGA